MVKKFHDEDWSSREEIAKMICVSSELFCKPIAASKKYMPKYKKRMTAAIWGAVIGSQETVCAKMQTN